MSENGPASGQPGKRKQLKPPSGQPAAGKGHHVEVGEMVVFKGAGGATTSADAQRIYRNEELYELHEKLRALEVVKRAVEPFPPSPPPLKRGLDDERDVVAREILRERGWGPEHRKQFWRLAGEVADRCPAQDGLTSFSTRRKALCDAFKRVTGLN
jgi:hypothetical protein